MISSTSVVAAGAVMGVGGALTYAGLWPESQWFGSVVVAGNDSSEIALTYDDGPNDGATERLLEVLARHEVRATFFLIGSFARLRPEMVRSIAAGGHLIGNHTMTHPWLAWQSARRIREEMSGCNAVLEDVLGAPVRYFRPPHGARRPYVLRVARELGLTAVQWNVMAGDWNPVDAATIAGRVSRGIVRNQRKGRASNVLLHDGGHIAIGQPRLPTVEATEQLLSRSKRSGMKFVTPEAWI